MAQAQQGAAAVAAVGRRAGSGGCAWFPGRRPSHRTLAPPGFRSAAYLSLSRLGRPAATTLWSRWVIAVSDTATQADGGSLNPRIRAYNLIIYLFIGGCHIVVEVGPSGRYHIVVMVGLPPPPPTHIHTSSPLQVSSSLELSLVDGRPRELLVATLDGLGVEYHSGSTAGGVAFVQLIAKLRNAQV